MSRETLISAVEGGDEQLALLITEGGPEYTRKALRHEIFRTAAKFAALGIKRGDVVAMSFDNDIELIICFIAVCHLGATAAPLNAKYKPDEVVFYLTDISCNLLVVPASGNKDAEQAAASVNVPVATALVDPDTGGLKLASKTGGGEGEVNLSSLSENESIEETRAGPEDTALFLHTSGTTGLPKGVPLSHRNMVTTMKNIAATYKLTSADRGYVVMPLFHVHGLMCALFGALYSKGSIVLPGKSAGFQAHLLWGHVKQYSCTWFTAVPTMHQSLLSSPKYYEDAGKPALRFIRSCSSSLPPPVLYKMEEVFQAPVIEAYAMTEACHQMTSNPLPEVGPHKAGSVGKAFNVDVAIMDVNGQEVPAGTVGEVCVKGPNITKGYHNRPEANADAFHSNGFFRTGDLGYLDEDGYVFLTGRSKEQINRGGEKIAPVAIDNVLLDCPGIAALFAFGVPHKELGETVAVVVVCKPGVPPVSLKQLNAFAVKSGKLAAAWLPSIIVYCDAVPKGPTGKVQRIKLSSMLGLPSTFSADDGPSSFRYTPGGQPLERLLEVSADETEDTSLSSLRSQISNVVGVDLSDQDDMIIDSFTAVKVGNFIKAKYNVSIPAKDCITLRISSVFKTVCQSRLSTPVQLTEVLEGILGIELKASGQDAALPMDSFSAVKVSNILSKKFLVDARAHDVLANGATVASLHDYLITIMGSGSSANSQATAEPITPADFEKEAELSSELQTSLTAAAHGLRSGSSSATTTGSVVLTGATGFIGAHILNSLLNCKNVTQVFCIVRSAGPEDGLNRIKAKFDDQKLACEVSSWDRVKIINGDTSMPLWSLSEASMLTLQSSSVRALIHNAAYVNHALQFRALHPHNVGSAQAAIQISCRIMEHTGVPVHCSVVSTGGVCGRLSFADADEPLRLPASALATQNGYVQGKWVSERLLENAAAFIAHSSDMAPLFSVFRPGAVSGHTSTGVCNMGDSYNRLVIGWILMGAAPPLDPNAQMDMSPVDWNASAIAGIVLQHSKLAECHNGGGVKSAAQCPIYTLDNGHSLTYENLINSLCKLGRQVRLTASYDEWLALLLTALAKEDEAKAMGGYSNPLRDLRGSLTSKPPKFGSTSCKKHMQLLMEHGYACPVIDEKYLTVYLKHFVEVGALPPLHI